MLLTEIDHVAIAVSDLDAAIDYYAKAFGAEVAHRETVESDGVEEALVKGHDDLETARQAWLGVRTTAVRKLLASEIPRIVLPTDSLIARLAAR